MRSFMSASSAPSRALAILLAVALLAVLPVQHAAAAPGPIKQRPSGMVTADALPTVQINGVVWTQATNGNTVYAGGQFTKARPAGSPAGQNETTRQNLLAFDITTGALITSFNPSLNATVKDVKVSPDGKRLYVAGSFTTANGQNRYRIAAYDTATGALISSFAPSTNATIAAIAVTNTVVYVGGWFSSANGVARTRLAAFSAADGSLLGWAPTADADIQAMTLTPDNSKVIIGGKFKNVNGASAYGMASLNATNGSLLPFAINSVVRNAGDTAGTYYLTRDGDTVYGTSFNFGTGNFEGVWAANPTSGAIKWLDDCHGDTYSAFSANGVVYGAGHPHYCRNIGGYPDTSPRQHHYLMAYTKEATGTVAKNGQTGSGYGNFEGRPAPSIINYFPTLTAANFTGQWQAAWSLSGNNDYLVAGGEFTKVNGSGQQGLVRFATSSKAPKKRGPMDSGALFTPTVTAVDGHAAKITWTSNWDQDDQELSYQVVRSDRTGTPLTTVKGVSQFWNRPKLSFVDSTAEPGKTYRYRIVAIDPNGNRATGDYVDITMPANTSLGTYAIGVLGDQPSRYWRLNSFGSSSSPDLTGGDDLRTNSVSRTSTGALLNNDDGAAVFTGSSLSRAGSQTQAAAPGTFAVEGWFSSTSSSGGKIIGYGNSQTGSSSSYDRHLYLDSGGRITFGVGSAKTVRSAKTYNDGGWHHLVGQLSSAGLELYVDGDRVAADPAVTTGPTYNGYWRIGGDNLSGWPNRPASNFLNGKIDEVAVYPAPLTAEEVALHYSASGRQSTNTPPVAGFSWAGDDLDLSFDAAGSTDEGGEIVSYDWDFGDGNDGTGKTVQHGYAAIGGYDVTLTVTDDDGMTGQVTKRVTAAGPGVVAGDAFGRTVATGWGNADVGGGWNTSGGSAFGTGDGVGRVDFAAPGTLLSAALGEPSAADLTMITDLAVDKVLTGNGLAISLQGRVVGNSDYRLKVRFLPGGETHLVLAATVNGSETILGEVNVPTATYQAGQALRVSFTISGSGTTTLAGKVWPAGGTEPAAAQLTRTDGTPSLQTAGSIGYLGYLSGNVGNAPVRLSVDNLKVIAP